MDHTHPVASVLFEPPGQERRADVMTTSSNSFPAAPPVREPLRLRLADTPRAGEPDGAWWPQSRNLQTEAADLVDHFPQGVGRVTRLLSSRPDWDNPVVGARGVHTIRAARGTVKVGSFPSDDTRLMTLTMATGQRLRLAVIPSDTAPAEAEQRLRSADQLDSASPTVDPARWDDENLGT